VRKINFNGKIISADKPLVSAANRGLRFGDGLFETMKYRNETLLFAHEHFERLWLGLKMLQFELPKHFTRQILQQQIIELLKKNKLDKYARIRLTIFRGNGGLYDAENNFPAYCIETWLLNETIGELNSNGLVMGIYKDVVKSCDAISNLKHNNYLPNVMAALKAKNEKWNDAIILNQHGRICESTIANVFFIKNDIVFTPALTEGCVAGVMRKHIIEQLRQNNFTVIKKEITISELLNADEIFCTNSIHNMRWVKQINGQEYGCQTIQKIYALLQPTFM
jgi:branched-chain amino acid aminotransferase